MRAEHTGAHRAALEIDDDLPNDVNEAVCAEPFQWDAYPVDWVDDNDTFLREGLYED